MRRKPLWLAVCFPDLALHAVVRDDQGGSGRPVAVYETVDGQLGIVTANASARRAGIIPGMAVGAALALIEDLSLHERSTDAEDGYLAMLADRAGRITPSISLQPREGLLLEIRASLKLFGGLDAIRRQLADEWDLRALPFLTGVAPTPLAALWSARHGNADLPPPHALATHLSGLPLGVTGWPEAVQKQLYEMGVSTVGDCLRLPRDGFTRRVGKACLQDLDRAMGKRPDPRPFYERPGSLTRLVDFPQETEDREAIIRALESGVETLARQLLQRQAQIRQIEVGFYYSRGVSDVVRVDFVDPLHTPAHLLAPIVVRLESLRLSGAVTAMRITTGPLLSLCVEVGSLFDAPEGRASTESAAVLIECLRGRFGHERVYGLCLHAEHRPEFAFTRLIDGLPHTPQVPIASAQPECLRPLWILPEPVPVSRDVLHSTAGSDSASLPERIESGWWDGVDVRRDYYVVMTDSGERWWVYRDRATREWWLHGIFG